MFDCKKHQNYSTQLVSVQESGNNEVSPCTDSGFTAWWPKGNYFQSYNNMAKFLDLFVISYSPEVYLRKNIGEVFLMRIQSCIVD